MFWLEFPHLPLVYTLCSFLGAALAGWTYRRWRTVLPLPPHVARLYYASIFVAAVFGAYSVQPLHTLFGSPDVTGHSVMSALFFGWITAEAMKWQIGLRAPTGEPLAVGLAGALAIGRIGCLFGHCCLGVPYDGPLALIDHGHTYFPAPLLEFGFHSLAFLLLWRWTSQGRLEGYRFRIYVAAYCIFRFSSEFLRGYTHIGFGLSLYQWLALILFGIIAVQTVRDQDQHPTPEAL